MNKKLIKIMAVVLIIGISAPMIVTAASNQGDVLTLFSNKKPGLETQTKFYKTSSADSIAEKVETVDSISEENFNIVGKWGIYDNNREGSFKGMDDKNSICGKTWYKNEKVYFYIQMNRITHTFNGVVIYNDNFHDIKGTYLKKDGKFIALWKTEFMEGWMAGEII
jgi:hypothetical protein